MIFRGPQIILVLTLKNSLNGNDYQLLLDTVSNWGSVLIFSLQILTFASSKMQLSKRRKKRKKKKKVQKSSVDSYNRGLV